MEGRLEKVSHRNQVNEIVNYFKDNEKDKEDFKIGIELEHFVIDKDTLQTISYYGEGGVEDTLKELESNGWEGSYEGEYLLGLNNANKVITLEPGSQLELSIKPQKDIKDIEKEYFQFLTEIIPILNRKNQGLIAVGYQPETKIDDIKILPKKRYDYMFEYFKDKGSHAHNMMKGTASLQLAFDYSSEEDYIKKFKTASALSPVVYAMFENALYFEGQKWNKHNLRSFIWENCDKDRSGIVKGTFDEDFGYEKYAEYILNGPPIFIDNGRGVYSTGDKRYKEIFNPEDYSLEELEHVLTMFFPDVRTKKYVEIRMMDAVPYPLNFSAIALWKGILYDENNLNMVYEYIKDISQEDVDRAKDDIIDKGLDGKLRDKSIYEIGKWLIDISKNGLKNGEKEYLKYLDEMIVDKKNPYELIKNREVKGKKEALSWCILNNLFEVN